MPRRLNTFARSCQFSRLFFSPVHLSSKLCRDMSEGKYFDSISATMYPFEKSLRRNPGAGDVGQREDARRKKVPEIGRGMFDSANAREIARARTASRS
jgi:hypothetical protein